MLIDGFFSRPSLADGILSGAGAPLTLEDTEDLFRPLDAPNGDDQE